VVFGAFNKMYPALTNVPLVLVEFEMVTLSCFVLNYAFINSEFFHVDGFL
jgi:hypothetical protein